MKAVIMAGGQGRRLKAVSGDMPKPMVPLLGRPMMEHIILLLKEQGFEDICCALKYRARDIISFFGDGSRLGVKLSYRVEARPLGTAGAVKNCRDFYGDEDFLVISGDAACDFDLRRLMEKRREENSPAALALYKSSSPLSYGLAVTDSGGFIKAFIEKPSWSRVVTDLVSTGIYALSPAAMEAVPEGREYDFAKELFPLLLKRGEKLPGLIMEGYWCDVGEPLSYYKCCADALTGRLRLNPGPGFKKSGESEEADLPSPGLICPCRDRAALMGALSSALMEMGADFSDGLSLRGKGYSLHISPLNRSSALRISVSSQDAEFSRSLEISAKELAEALDL